jgi:hypothetical protein
MGADDVFTVVVMFMGFDWKPKHVTLNLFEIANIINMLHLLKIYELKSK